MANRIPVMVDVDVYDKLECYSKLVGQPSTHIIEEALEDWLWTVGEARLETLAGVKVQNVLVMQKSDA